MVTIRQRLDVLDERLDCILHNQAKFNHNVAARLDKLEACSSRQHPNSEEIVFQIEKLAALLADDNTMFAPVAADTWEIRLKQFISDFVQLPD